MRRNGTDVGGARTDAVLDDDAAGDVWSTKVPSAPKAPSVGAHDGLKRNLELSRTTPANVGFIGCGTTIAINMVIGPAAAPPARGHGMEGQRVSVAAE